MRTNSILVLLSLILASGLVISLAMPALAQSTWYPRSEDYVTTGDVYADNLVLTGDGTIEGSFAINGSLIDDGNVSTATNFEENITMEKNLTVSEYVIANLIGDVTGTASNINIGDFINTEYGVKNTSNKILVNLTANDGLEFGTGATLGSLGVKTGDGLDTGASGVLVDVTDVIDTAAGLKEDASNNVQVNLSNGLKFGTGADAGAVQVDAEDASLAVGADGVKVAVGKFNQTSIAGGAAGDHTLTGIAVGDELIGVLYFAKADGNLTAITDIQSEFTVGANKISNPAGTVTSGGYLVVTYLDRT